MPLSGVKTFRIEGDKGNIFFILKRSDKSKESWRYLVKQRDNFFGGKVDVSVGVEGGVPIASDKEIYLDFIPAYWFYICAIPIVLFLTYFIKLSACSNIIRDLGPAPPESSAKKITKAFSIGRTQMAFWFFLIVASYIYLYLTTGELNTITGSVLVLMGISAGTAIGASLIDKNKIDVELNSINQIATLDAHITTLQDNIKKINGVDPNNNLPLFEKLTSFKNELGEAERKRREVEQEIEDHKNIGKARRTRSFLYDLLSENSRTGDGGSDEVKLNYSFHRFQIIAWTIVLGVIFIIEVYENSRMPEFSNTLLALMGISSGTYCRV
jgi:hypothetical protein